MRTLRFHQTGPALDVLHLEEAEIPVPGPGQIRVAVQSCGLNPADWALCNGLFAGNLPRGIGLEVSGTVDAVGAEVTGVAVGDTVFGPAPFTGPTAGASDYALLDVFFPRPAGLEPDAAAALPMAVETAHRGLHGLGVRRDAAHGLTVLVHGAGGTVGYAAVQIALRYGAQVIATAGRTYADALRAMGAQVTSYGDGMAERVRELAGGPVDLALDAAPISNSLPEVVRTVRTPEDALTLSDFAAAQELGVRFQFGEEGNEYHNDVLPEYAQLAADGTFTVPVARTFPLEDWRAATELSLSGKAGGKLILHIG
ncbi:zinc-binding dehydrogenase [Streptomyces sp. SID8381]|uniref:NADP-dependent oxidoreductase n=1 Tax=unclassified Streptomyces TaxID=2593676 RepID=UPI000365B568|nr:MULTISPECIES: NADP-dependent oxidoreductase [unclassified Streptomyces]MYX28820.1 zinc-binding dehydrogenase [Streptomyces sp. SID8381]